MATAMPQDTTLRADNAAAALALGAMSRARVLIASARSAGQSGLDEAAGKAVLAAFGMDVPRFTTGASPQEVAANCRTLRPPLALKLLSPNAVHKSDFGGVRLSLDSEADVRCAAEDMLAAGAFDAAGATGFLAEEMAPAGQEMVIGGFRDPQFGPMVMLGLGGVFVEILADISFRLCPIDRAQAAAMLGELRAAAVLDGARGRRKANTDAILDALLQVGGADGLLMRLQDEVEELDINPLIVSERGAVAVDARIVLSAPAETADRPARRQVPESFEPLFAPKTIAVAGVSASGNGPGNRFIRNLRELAFAGEIYPIHPTARELEGVEAFPDFAAVPKPVDYAFVAIPRDGVPDLLRSANGTVRFAQIMTSGFDDDAGSAVSQHAVAEAARAAGMRLLGPNSLGTYSPRGRLTFAETRRADAKPGSIGIVSQSGGIGVDLIRTGQARGLRYSGIVTIGNSIDLGPIDFLEHFLKDPGTSVIGLYLEDVGDGRRFVELLDRSNPGKPVVLLKGGRSRQGRTAAISHTGALAGDDRVWRAAAAKTGCIMVDTIEELIDVLQLFQTVQPRAHRATRNLALFGNGGGASVVAMDGFAKHGFDLAAIDGETRQRLDALDLPAGASGGNPIDLPANAFNRSDGRIAGQILNAVRGDDAVDAIVMHLNMPVLLSYRDSAMVPNIVDAAIDYRRSATPKDPHLVLVLRSDGTEQVDSVRRTERWRAVEAGIPVVDSFSIAGSVLAALSCFETHLGRGVKGMTA